jgi:arsenate reductase
VGHRKLHKNRTHWRATINIILYGTKKCPETRKAQRYFQERKLPVQFRDIGETPVSEGELKNLTSGRDASALIDTGSKRFLKRGFAFMEYDAFEELLADNALMVTPIIRIDRKVYIRPVLEELPV